MDESYLYKNLTNMLKKQSVKKEHKGSCFNWQGMAIFSWLYDLVLADSFSVITAIPGVIWTYETHPSDLSQSALSGGRT